MEIVMGPHQSIEQIREDKIALVLARIKEFNEGTTFTSHPGFEKMLKDAIYSLDYLALPDITLEGNPLEG